MLYANIIAKLNKEQFVKLDAFDKAIESTIDFRNLFKWFRNQDVRRMLEKMYLYIEEKKFDKAEELADILDEKSNGYTEGVAKARILISRGRRHEKNK